MRRALLLAWSAAALLAPLRGGAFSAAPEQAMAQAAFHPASASHQRLDSAQLTLFVKLSVRQEQRENFLRLMKARIADSRMHPAVLDFRILATNDPQVFQGVESFTNRAAFDDFAASPQSRAFLESMKPVLSRALEVTFLSPLPQPGDAGPAAPAAQQPPAYGPPLTMAMARKAMVAAEALAAANGWNQAIAIIDSGGHLVLFHKFDNTHLASIAVAQGKARTALDYRRATATLELALAAGGAGLRYLGIPGTMPLEGGVPILDNGKVVGAIGVSGVASANDALVAQAGADALR